MWKQRDGYKSGKRKTDKVPLKNGGFPNQFYQLVISNRLLRYIAIFRENQPVIPFFKTWFSLGTFKNI